MWRKLEGMSTLSTKFLSEVWTHEPKLCRTMAIKPRVQQESCVTSVGTLKFHESNSPELSEPTIIICINWMSFGEWKELFNTDLPPCKPPLIQLLEFPWKIQILLVHYLDGDYSEGIYDTNVISEATYISLMHKGLHWLLQLKIDLWNQYICTCKNKHHFI